MNILRNIYRLTNLSLRNIRPLYTSPVFLKDTNMSNKSAKNIVWVDLEMTGLDIEKDKILEIACLITDGQLNILEKGPHLIVHQPDEVLNTMNEWCIQQHGVSGLTEASRQSKISLQEAETQILKFISTYVPEKKCPLAGNSVYMDRLFILKYMPRLFNYLHYRIIDVSSIKELAKRWYQKEYSRLPAKKFQHRALDDIIESIEELKYYRQSIFKGLNDIDKETN